MEAKTATLISSGDLRLAANQTCWAAQVALEDALVNAFAEAGYRLVRAHGVDREKGHGFIDSQRRGIEVFSTIDADTALVVAVAGWQYSHHVLPGLSTHRGPILTVANWSGEFPGLVGLLNLNASLSKAGVPYQTLWSVDFSDDWFRDSLRSWLDTRCIDHDLSHVRSANEVGIPDGARRMGTEVARELRRGKAIIGVFDEGCMGMYNAIVPDNLLNATGIFKERLSQSALYYEATLVKDEEAQVCRNWLDVQGMRFNTGPNPETDLTDDQILWQLKTYIAAVRIADDFGCDAIGIQYQQGLRDLLPASDLAEGLLNNTLRPPVYARNDRRELYAGRALPHFNEVDECAGIDALVTHRLWCRLGFDPETTLHDLRWGESYDGEYVWVFEISGAVPPAHLLNGYGGAVSERQPAMFFRLGGGTVKGISKPGEIVWSRIFVEDDRLKADVGRGRAVMLPEEETLRRWNATNPQWPIMHAVTYGVSRDQMMARHKSNHIQVAYAPDAPGADAALAAKVAAFSAMGIETFVCGDRDGAS